MRIPPHLFTLCALAVGLLGLVPAMAQVDRSLEGDKNCTVCHDADWKPPVLSIYQTKHGVKADGRTPGCQSCHGASAEHREDPSNKSPEVVFGAKSKKLSSVKARNAACLSCHEFRILPRTNWSGSQHETRGVACSDCHDAHAPTQRVFNKLTQPEVCFACHKDKRAEVNRPSHHPVLEGKVACSDCHNPHGSVGPSLVKRDNVRDTCFQCHAEKRGPFVHNHQPATEACTICHNPHGTVVESMLKVRPPFLCHQCHTPHGGFIPQVIGAQVPGLKPTTPAGVGKGPTNFTQGRGCLNCHTEVHGSNNPSATSPTPQFMLR